MKRVLYISIALFLLVACLALVQLPDTEEGGEYSYNILRLTFDVQCTSGWPFGDWDFVYTYNGKEVESGHRVLFPAGIFSFHSIQVDVAQKNAPENAYSVTFPFAMCDGGSGDTEVTLTDSKGRTATYKITCKVKRVGKQ